jgi:hypothetical protein
VVTQSHLGEDNGFVTLKYKGTISISMSKLFKGSKESYLMKEDFVKNGGSDHTNHW